MFCGRELDKSIPVYAKQGVKALEDWLAGGVKNINAVNAAIKSAKPWYAKAALPFRSRPGWFQQRPECPLLRFLTPSTNSVGAMWS